MVLLPVLNVQLDFYSTAHDPLIRTMQLAGLIVIALAARAIWSMLRLWKVQTSWVHRLGNGMIAAALLGLVWLALVGGLISFDLNYQRPRRARRLPALCCAPSRLPRLLAASRASLPTPTG
jgi:hypothetical protein